MDAVETKDVARLMREIGAAARAAQRVLALASTEAKNKALIATAESLRRRKNGILSENAKDMTAGAKRA